MTLDIFGSYLVYWLLVRQEKHWLGHFESYVAGYSGYDGNGYIGGYSGYDGFSRYVGGYDGYVGGYSGNDGYNGYVGGRVITFSKI